MNRRINSLWKFNSKELKKISDSKSRAALDDTYESNGFISLKLLWLVWFNFIYAMWSCKHRIWCYNVWVRKCVKLIWSNSFDRVLAALEERSVSTAIRYKKCGQIFVSSVVKSPIRYTNVTLRTAIRYNVNMV